MKIRSAELFLFAATLFCGIFLLNSGRVKGETITTAIKKDPVPITVGVAAFSALDLQAKAAYVYDLKEGKVLYAKNENAPLPLASLTKIMTAMVATELLPNTSTITIHADDLKQDGDNGLFLWEKWNFRDLLDFTMTVSSNDGAHAIASAAGALSTLPINPIESGTTTNSSDTSIPEQQFIAEMNKKANNLGLIDMSFTNETGLDTSTTTNGGYGSAKEITQLFSDLITQNPQLLEATTHKNLTLTSQSQITHTIKNTDTAVNIIPSLIASKTGYTDLAGGNLIIAYDAGVDHPIIVCVLGSSIDGRFTDVKKLTDASLTYFSPLSK